MKGQYTHYVLCDVTKLTSTITDRYDWDSINEVSDYPSMADAKAVIVAFLANWAIDYSADDTKSELLALIDLAKPVGSMATNSANIQDMIDKHPLYFAPRYNPDKTKVIFKGDWTLSELKALGTGFSIFTNEEAKAHLNSSADWKND